MGHTELLSEAGIAHLAGLVLALVLGALIGLERQLRRHPAGLHTDALVSLGAAAYVVAGTLLGGGATEVGRIASQVVTGVGFLCAGVIMHEGITVRGINTAATVWCSAAVGVLAGLGLLAWATAAAVLIVLCNVILHQCEHLLEKDAPPASLK